MSFYICCYLIVSDCLFFIIFWKIMHLLGRKCFETLVWIYCVTLKYNKTIHESIRFIHTKLIIHNLKFYFIFCYGNYF